MPGVQLVDGRYQVDGDDFWLTSDTHFSHARIIELSDRPFHSIGGHDGELYRRWNSVVPVDGTVIHLGDLALGELSLSLPRTHALHGHRYLAPGNHDRISRAFNHGKNIERFTPIYEAAGWTILPEVIPFRLAGQDVLLSHYPYDGDSRQDRGDRHAHIRAVDDGLPMIHGHVHTEFAIRGRQFNVGVDQHDFTPIHASVVVEWLNTL